MRLDELPLLYADRLKSARDPAAWSALCADARAAAWLAWNMREDAWYGPAELARVQGEIDAAPAGLMGPELLAQCARALRSFRQLSPDEQRHLPADGLNHVATRSSRRYELAPASAWAEGSVPGEIANTLAPGDRIQLLPRMPQRSFAWLTFEANGRAVPRDPDDILRQLGLPWKPEGGPVLRVAISMAALRAAGATFALPTLFDAQLKFPDWRARPAREHRTGEPWGERPRHADRRARLARGDRGHYTGWDDER